MSYHLLPNPRELEIRAGAYHLAFGNLILLDTAQPQGMLFMAKKAQEALDNAGFHWEIVTGKSIPAEKVGLTLRAGSQRVAHEQGYLLEVNENGIIIEAPTEQGVFYGICTLAQILFQIKASQLPYLSISDYPDYPVRGVMLDVSRNKVPTMQTVLELVDKLAGWKVNQFQLYFEHTFAYQRHPIVWANASPFTGQEIMELDAFCRERFIELVPNQNSFGHLTHWLKHPEYSHLAETMGPWEAWGTQHDYPFSLNATDPKSLELVRGLFDELLPYFTSNQFNVGLDETLDLGSGKSKEAVEKYGRGRIYLDFLKKVYQEVKKRGKTMQFWGDIIIEHPDLIAELPKDAIALHWGYEEDEAFGECGEQYAKAGLEFYVCPGTSSWNSIGGRTKNALGNLINAAENGLKHGATGYLNTDWGDNGHWQVLPISYLGFGMGAAYSWALEANRDTNVPQVISLHAFGDKSGTMGKIAYELGNVYLTLDYHHNGSALFYALTSSVEKVRGSPKKPDEKALDTCWQAINDAMAPLNTAQVPELIKREFRFTERLMLHAVQRLRWIKGDENVTASALYVDMKAIISEFEALWHQRYRPGGLSDSIETLKAVRKDYA
ncbi:MAG: family 20 glycosylhydrolase [Anaerolineales bacterium]|nr:family 20 glycosylhydrolase [Anaerolineales bacterium]